MELTCCCVALASNVSAGGDVFKLAMQKRRGPMETPVLVDFTSLYTHVNDGVDVKWKDPPSTLLSSICRPRRA
jgi:hypothetical protein